MGRNPLGARLPPSLQQAAPRILPDGSESVYHGGSFRSYMAHKNRKLAEQFEERAGGQRRSTLFQGVSIMVDGFTSPSHLELRELMALHGGRFENYYSRSTGVPRRRCVWLMEERVQPSKPSPLMPPRPLLPCHAVTHMICSNLPDAKVKQLQKARDPIPIVRPEWVVDSIQCGRLLPVRPPAARRKSRRAPVRPTRQLAVASWRGEDLCADAPPLLLQLEDYALWQLRDMPGQRPLRAFAQVQPAQLPPSAIYGKQAGVLGAALEAPAGAAGGGVGGDGGEGSAVPGANATSASPPPFSFDQPAGRDAAQGLASAAAPPAFPQQLQQQTAHDFTFVLPQQPASPSAVHAQAQGGAASVLLAPPAAPAEQHAGAAAVGPSAQTAVGAPATAVAAGEPPAQAVGHYDAAEMQRAQQVAARMRAECDVLKWVGSPVGRRLPA